MSKLFKKDTKQFLNTLHKLTDKRFSFNIMNNCMMGYRLETTFCGNYIGTCSIKDFDITTAVYCLIDLVNYAELKHDQEYFDKFGISFKIYRKNLNGKTYYLLKKGDKCVKIKDKLASYILEQNDISIDVLYDCYNVNLKGV